jgi:hypothetical protein
MKKVITVLCVIALTLALGISMSSAAGKPASSYTLTVASSNPASGVAITVSPADKSGLSNGTTQFTRSYNSGTAVNLTAPATASGNNFSKWQKGSVDYATTASISVTMTANTTMTAVYVTPPTSSNYKVLAWNDLGMHCACPGAETFLILPPFNTIRAQVFQYGPNDPVVVSSGVNVTYSMLDNNENDNYLINTDPYYKNIIAFSPKMFPGYQPVVNGKIVSISGAGLAGNMTYNATPKAYEVVGVPAFPVPTGTSSDVMNDPFSTSNPKRTPYLTAQIKVTNTAGTVLATTNTTVPVAFGGCCPCHLKLASANGYTADPRGSFNYMGKLHATKASTGRTASKIDFSLIDPDGDGIGGPIRCSVCHWDPAMGETAAPGLAKVWPNYKILAGAGFTSADVKVSQYSFSDVLHSFHSQSSVVLTQFDANIAKNCYNCHPGNMTGDSFNCYRGAMKSASIYCFDCHGDLNQRVAAGSMTQPWQQSTLPTCNNPSPNITTAWTGKCHDSRLYPTPGTWDNGLFGKFINSRGHKGSILCSTCHGSPHAEAPSTLAQDQTQLKNAQSDAKPLGVCTYCHPNKSSSYGVPPHGNITK